MILKEKGIGTLQDLIVPLFRLPAQERAFSNCLIRAVFPAEKNDVVSWIQKEFGRNWASEFEYAAGLSPISAYIAIERGSILGFACFDAAAKGVFGPTGVSKEGRGRGVGSALLFRALTDMRSLGYAYAIIGAAGPVEYYERTVGAIRIENDSPGFLGSIVKSSDI